MKITIGNFEIYPDMIPTIDRVMNKSVSVPINDLLTLQSFGNPEDMQKEIARQDRRIEGLLEQNFNAVETFELIESIVKHYSAKDGALKLMAAITSAINDTHFER